MFLVTDKDRRNHVRSIGKEEDGYMVSMNYPGWVPGDLAFRYSLFRGVQLKRKR